MPIKIKICGITNAQDAEAAVAAGADALGFVFYAQSPRCIEPAVATRMIAQLPYFILFFLFSLCFPIDAFSDNSQRRADLRVLEIQSAHFGLNIPNGWTLKINGKGEGFIFLDRHAKEFPLTVPLRQISEFLQIVSDEGFFDLPEGIGVFSVDGGNRKIIIRTPEGKHSVSFPSQNLVDEDEVSSIRKALRIWGEIRGFFEDPLSIDSRSKDKEFLKAHSK